MKMTEKIVRIGLDGYRILQAPNMTKSQMMSYLIVTPREELVVIDGGQRGDSKYLTEKIHEFGSVVSVWIITHVHCDHYYALTDILEQPDMNGITIKKLCYSFPPSDWIYNTEPDRKKDNTVFLNLLPDYQSITQILYEGNKLNIDGMVIEILKDSSDYNNGYIGTSAVNDTSIVFRLIFPNGRTALFLSDLGFRAGRKLAHQYKTKLKSDIVQMAHHGQDGVGEEVYGLVKPKLCLWTAPKWLYDNNMWYFDEDKYENKFNSCQFKTVTVRRWMENMGVKMHAVEGEGPTWIE